MPQLEAAPNRQKTLTKPIRPFRGHWWLEFHLQHACYKRLVSRHSRPLRTPVPQLCGSHARRLGRRGLGVELQLGNWRGEQAGSAGHIARCGKGPSAHWAGEVYDNGRPHCMYRTEPVKHMR